MRIAFVTAMVVSPWGGSEELWSQTALRLRDESHQVAAFVVQWPVLHPSLVKLQQRGVDLFRRIKGPRNFQEKIWCKIRGKEHAQREVLKWRPELVVISQGGYCDGLAWMDFFKKMNVPYDVISQCNSSQWWPNDDLSASMARAYGGARKVYCVSRNNLEQLELQIGAALPQAQVVWNPFNVSVDPPPAWPEEGNPWKVACVARLEPDAKGQDLLFRVLAQPQWENRPIEFNLYGGGPAQKGVAQLIARFNLKNVRIRGHVDDVRQIWEENHLLILPSRYEGLSLALVEAMWCGRPALVTDVGGNAELCLDNKTGFVASAPVVICLSETLERAWARRHEWKEMGLAARRHAEQVIPTDPIALFCQNLLNSARL